MFFRSERLFLRPGWPEDWSDLFNAVADEAVVRNLAQVPWPYRPEDAQAYAALAQEPRYPHFLVVLPGAAGEQLVGSVSLMRGMGGRTEVGYWITRAHWGCGYGTEAVRAALVAARTLGHKVVYAAHFHDNPASGRVLRKAGFVPTGQVERRYSCARGTEVPALLHAIEIAAPNDCGGGDDPLMRAA